MGLRKHWQNDKFSIFTIDEEGPWYRTSMGIFRMMEEVGKRGRVIFHGALPFIDGSVKLGVGETHEIVEMDYGMRPDDYHRGVVIVQLRDCRLRRYWIGRMVAAVTFRQGGPASVEGYVEVECDIEWNEPLEVWEDR